MNRKNKERTIKKKHKPRRDHLLLEGNSLVHFPRESIDEEFPRPGGGYDAVHCVFEELDRHFHRYDFAFFDIVSDQLAKLGAVPVLLGSKQVPGCQKR